MISLFTKAITLASKCLAPHPCQNVNLVSAEALGHPLGQYYQPSGQVVLNLEYRDHNLEEADTPSTLGLAAASSLAEEIKDKLIERFSIRLK